MSVGEPTADRNSMLGVEDIGCWGVVDDDCILKITAQLRQILNVVSLMVVATFTEKTVVDNVVDVQLIEQRITVLFTWSAHA